MLTILEIFKDYMGGDIPENARVRGIRYHANDKGKLGLMVESPDWTAADAAEPLIVHFDLRLFMPVGGK